MPGKRGANLGKITLCWPPIPVIRTRGTDCQKLYLRVKNSVLRVLIAVFLLIIVSSCFEEGDCLITNSHIVKVSLKQFKDKTTAEKVLMDSVYIPGVATVFKPDKPTDSVTQVNLVIDPSLTQVQYVFRYHGKTDTLDLTYDNFVVIPSPTCGALLYQRNLAISESTFGQDSIAITERSLLRNVGENVSIYY